MKVNKILALVFVLCFVVGIMPAVTAETNIEMSIWTPSDYSDDVKYDVVLLLHGGKDNCTDMTYVKHYLNPAWADVFENIEGRPFIVVSINNRNDRERISQDIINTFCHMAEHYSTYAEDGSADAIIAARDHFTVGGVSNGSYSSRYFMEHYSSYAANYIFLSTWGKLPAGEDILPLKNVFVGCGSREEDFRKIALSDYERISELAEDPAYGEYDGGHNWYTWTNLIEVALKEQFK